MTRGLVGHRKIRLSDENGIKRLDQNGKPLPQERRFPGVLGSFRHTHTKGIFSP